MALTIGDNFSYMGAKPLDARLKYDTITAMVSMAASTLYDGIMAYCAEDGKTYQWKSTNTTDPTLGKWREFETGSAQVQADWTQTTDTEPDYIKHKPTLGTAAAKDSTNAVTQSSTDLIESGAVYTGLDTKVDKTSVGTASGVAELDANGKVPSSQLPSFVDDVVEAYYDSTTDRFYEEAAFTTVIPPESGKSWVDLASNKSYRWTGSVYVRVDEGVQLGETSDTAYRGDRGKTAYDFSQNPATATPQMDGVGSAGSSGKWSREDHVHPSDTSKTDLGVVAASFDDTATYAIDDRCTYNGKLYRFTSVHTGAWVAGDVTEVTVDGEIPEALTAAQMQAIKDAFEPTVRPDMMPVLFDETGAERTVGWYRLANGKKKPEYQKDFVYSNSITVDSTYRAVEIADISSLNVDSLTDLHGSSDGSTPLPSCVILSNVSVSRELYTENNKLYLRVYRTTGTSTLSNIKVSMRYTKSTDTPID